MGDKTRKRPGSGSVNGTMEFGTLPPLLNTYNEPLTSLLSPLPFLENLNASNTQDALAHCWHVMKIINSKSTLSMW